jgi:hypothetical protein
MTNQLPESPGERLAREWVDREPPYYPPFIVSRQESINAEVKLLAADIDAAIREALDKALRFARHRHSCAGFPAASDEDVIRKCDCGFVELFGKDYMERKP